MSSLAYVFPGQGSQSVGMLAELADCHPWMIDLFSAASDRLGYDLWAMIQTGPEALLNQTEHTQAAMLVADVAVYEVLRQQQAPQANMMAGHSLGEYAALTCAGALALPDAAALVAKRGQLMQETVPLGQGAMAAIIGLSEEEVQTICREASGENEQVTPANYNAIGQIVIAGHTNAVEEAMKLADAKGARMSKLIPVSVPCHCMLMMDAACQFEDYLRQAPFKTPNVPVISNVDLSIYQSVDQICQLLKEQLYSPVRWVETIQIMKTNGIHTVVEVGPGKVLSGLVKRIDKSLVSMNVSDEASLNSVLNHIQQFVV